MTDSDIVVQRAEVVGGGGFSKSLWADFSKFLLGSFLESLRVSDSNFLRASFSGGESP